MKPYKSLFEENTLITFYGKNWSSFTKDIFTSSINELLNIILKSNKNNINGITIKSQSSKKMSYVPLTDKSIKTKKFDVVLSVRNSYNTVLKSLSHELIHVKQIAEGSLDYNGKDIVWRNKIFDPKEYKLDQRKGKEKNKGYYEAPWEVEAYKDESKYYNLLKNSNVFKNLKKEWDLKIKEKTNNKFNFEDIMSSSFSEPSMMGQLFDNINYIG